MEIFKEFKVFGKVMLVMLVMFFPMNYLLLMPMSLGFVSMWVYLVFATATAAVVAYIADEDAVMPFLVPVILTAFFVIYAFFTSTLFTSDHRRGMIGSVETKTFSSEIRQIDITQVPIVNQAYATRLGNKVLGDQVALGSKASLGEFTKQSVKGKLMWVAPLLHSGFFAWNSNKEGTPGYITVSATNPDDVHLVQKIGGMDIRIKYQPEAFFSDDLKRHIRFSHMTEGLTDFSFELDDNMNPYWVVTKYENTSGFGARNAIGVCIVNAENGEMKDYSIKETPAWVDRIQPEDFVNQQINFWGKLVHGVFNFSNEGKLMTTEGSTMIYNKGVCYYYHGLTSIGRDESTVGFVLTDSKTKETTFYKVSGCIERSAMNSAEGKVQSSEYKADYPLLINIEGVPTYFTPLKDNEGIIRMFAMVNVVDYTIVAVGATVEEARENYVTALSGKGNWTSLESSSSEKTIRGTIRRIGFANHDGKTFGHVVLVEMPHSLFVIGLGLSNELPITKDGDKVSIKYNNANSTSVVATGFDNLEFTQDVSEAQKTISQSHEKVQKEKQDESNQKDMDSLKESIENLTPEQKAQVEKIINKN